MPSRMTFHQAVRGHITVHPGHAAHHGHTTDVDELMDAKAAADHRPVFDDHVTGHLDGIGHHDPVPQLAVVTEMAIGHQQVAVADPRHLPFIGGAVDRHALSEGVAITDHHLRQRTPVLEVLGFLAQAGTRKHLVVATKSESPLQHRMGADPTVLADYHLRTHNGARADHHPRS